MQTKDGKDKCQPFRCSVLSENYNGEPIAFEWKIFAGTTASEILQKIQKDFEGQRIRPESFSDPVIFMSMFNDIDLDKKGNGDSCNINSRKIKMYASRFIDRHWVFLGPREKSKWYQGYAVNCGKWILRASPIVEEFENSGNPVFKGVSPLGRGTLKMRSGRNTIHFNGECDNIDLLFRTVYAANQLCFYGAVTRLCEKQPEADSGKACKGRPESDRRTPREIQIKQEERMPLVDIPRLPLASENRMLQNLENFESMPFMSKIESLRAAAKFYHPIEIGNYFVTTLLDDD